MSVRTRMESPAWAAIRQDLAARPDPDLYAAARANDPAWIADLVGFIGADSSGVKFHGEKVLRRISACHPACLLPHLETIAALLDGENRFIKWGTILTMANLAAAAPDDLFPGMLARHLSLIDADEMVAAANAIGSVGKFVAARPACETEVTRRLSGVENNTYRHHGEVSPECRNILIGDVMAAFERYWDHSGHHAEMLAFASRHRANPRPAVARRAAAFLHKHETGIGKGDIHA